MEQSAGAKVTQEEACGALFRPDTNATATAFLVDTRFWTLGVHGSPRVKPVPWPDDFSPSCAHKHPSCPPYCVPSAENRGDDSMSEEPFSSFSRSQTAFAALTCSTSVCRLYDATQAHRREALSPRRAMEAFLCSSSKDGWTGPHLEILCAPNGKRFVTVCH